MRSICVLAAAALAGCLAAPPEGLTSVGGADAAGAGEEDAATAVDLVASGPASSTDPLGGGGGDPYDAICPDGRFVTGLAASENGAGMTSVQAICGRFQVGLEGEIELIDSENGEAVVGDTDSTALEPVECSPGLVVVAYDGSANGNEVVSHLRFACAPLGYDGIAVVRAPTEQTAVIGTPDDTETGGGTCPEGTASAGIAGRFGLLVDAFELECFEVLARAAE